MKKYVVFLLAGVLLFLVGCASAPITQTGNFLGRESLLYDSEPTTVIVNNQTTEKVSLVIDGTWKQEIASKEIRNIKFKNIRERMIFNLIFSDNKERESLKYVFPISPGRKFLITVPFSDGKIISQKKGTRRLVPVGDGFEIFYRANTTRAIDKMLERMNKK